MSDQTDHVIVSEHVERRNRNRAPIAILALLIVGAIGGWLYYVGHPRPAEVTQRDIVGLIPVSGEVVSPPSARADIGAPFKATVDKVDATIGRHVSKGDVLVRLSVPNAEAIHEQTKANLKAAETAYANTKIQYDRTIDAAQRQLDIARTAEAAERQPHSTTNADGSVTTVIPGTNGQATANRIAADQALLRAKADRDAGLAPYEQQLEAAREANKWARSGEKMGYIRSPISGTVLALNAQPGQQVGNDPKVPVATVVNLDALQIQAPLDDSQAAAVKPGMPVLVTVAEIPNKKLEGKVSRLTSQVVSRAGGLVKQSRYVALIDFKNTDGLVKPGMKPQAALKTGEARNALAVPADAIDKDKNGNPSVKTMRNGAWQAVVVEPGVTDGKYTEIKSGLQKGETIQVTPNLLQAATLKK